MRCNSFMSTDLQDLPTRVRHVLEDPSAQAIAKSYAFAFLDAAAAKGDFEALATLTSFVDDVLSTNPRSLNSFSHSPLTGRETTVLGILGADRHSERLAMWLPTSCECWLKHDRMDLIRVIVDQAWRENETAGREERRVDCEDRFSR